MSRAFTIIFFIALSLGGGMAIGYFARPGEWYEMLVRPSFAPPNWLFGPVWTFLYILIGFAGARVWRLRDGTALKVLWFVQMGLNFLWPPVFFVAHRLDLAMAVIAALLISILAFIALAFRQERPSAILFLPYAAWVMFASALNAAFLYLNAA